MILFLSIAIIFDRHVTNPIEFLSGLATSRAAFVFARDSVAYKSYKISNLNYWRDASNTEFPQLAMMVRDTLAVPAKGAGVEREFRCTVRKSRVPYMECIRYGTGNCCV